MLVATSTTTAATVASATSTASSTTIAVVLDWSAFGTKVSEAIGGVITIKAHCGGLTTRVATTVRAVVTIGTATATPVTITAAPVTAAA